MPSTRKLDPEEIKRLEENEVNSGGQRAAILREYDGYLSEFAPGEYGEAVLAEDESKLNVRNRLKAAAERRGWTIEFIRTSGPSLRFKVSQESSDEATEVFAPVHEEEMAIAA